MNKRDKSTFLFLKKMKACMPGLVWKSSIYRTFASLVAQPRSPFPLRLQAYHHTYNKAGVQREGRQIPQYCVSTLEKEFEVADT